MRTRTFRRGLFALGLGWAALVLASSTAVIADEPDAATYWDVKDLRPGMKGVGRTVMVGSKLEEFGAEVLGVMRDVSPGRDMVLCRLSGCNLEHAGIIQGMSGSPIYIDGKLVGAVAFAWEFAKDPIAGVTPFQQMVKYVRASDRRLAAEALEEDGTAPIQASLSYATKIEIEGLTGDEPAANRLEMPLRVSGGGAGMIPIATPLAASGFSPRALAMLDERLRPLGMAPMSGGRASDEIIQAEGEKPFEPGSPLSIAMVMGDFDLSGIGTVTHVEGNRVYGFGHPMFSLGNCEFPMMTGYIHTVYPRASVSMKMGSPLKVVGVVDADVSTGVAGRIGAKPDMLPMSVRVKTGKYADARTYKVGMVREPSLTSALIMSILTSAIDTEGNLPEELTARLRADVHVEGHGTITLQDTFSGPRYTGPMGASALFGPLASIVNILVKNPMGPVRIAAIDCDVEIEDGRRVAAIESVRLQSVTVEPGGTLKAFVTLKPYKGERRVVEASVQIPADFPEGSHEAVVCDLTNSARRRFRNDPIFSEPRDLEGILSSLRLQTEPKRTEVYLHVQTPERGLAVNGVALPNLPASARAAFGSKRQAPASAIRSDLIQAAATPWVVEGNQTLKFTVAKDAGLSLSLE
ncbi:SpoIVB peptidase S55 domain-containing protein [Planctomyces sp. SH-PL62]|uniref:SpoIVB peptidase S55 domain-containing protein n=1 Tax=Planctomyces sp. SH-PL62 TaxID=1636152 RepID=UPI00078C4319|nr:SpoIVB peptidase S55 domain-containing protein [Planctomyces sp. SH-PL62]AMV39422.1 SpoIVB peptidase S55 [Planctomyces sp. SH-PL62]